MTINGSGYLRIGSPEAKEWEIFGREVLGMALTDDPLGRADTVSPTVGDRLGRLRVTGGDRNRVRCGGWELAHAGASTVEDEDSWDVTHRISPSIWGHRAADAPPAGCLEEVAKGANE